MVAAGQGNEAQRSPTERLAALDLLRGVAAASVLAWHSTWQLGVGAPFGRAYLAVDFFFVLSGFVIAHAYQHRLSSRRQLLQYCRARLIRLYPLYAMATLVAATVMLGAAFFGHGAHPSPARILASLATAALFLPTPERWSVQPQFLFPLVFTAWSLLWELLVNLLYGLISVCGRRSFMFVALGVGAAGVGFALHRYGQLDRGWSWEGAGFGAPRSLFGFFAGVLVFEMRKRFRAPALPALLLAAAFLLLLVPNISGIWAYDAICVFLMFPLLVWLGADASYGRRLGAVGIFAGFMSYPLYLLQGPFEIALAPVELRVANSIPLTPLARLSTYLAVTLLGSWIIARWLDSPVREWLRSRSGDRTPRPAAQTAP